MLAERSWNPPDLRVRTKVGLLVALAVLAVGGAMLVAPIAQDPAYHQFADRRAFLGSPNFGDAVSNLGFLVVGAIGLVFVLGRPGRAMFAARGERWPYAVLFAGIASVALGSAYYHLDPTTGALFWDRLPMSVAFMALFAAIVMDRIHLAAGLVALPVAVGLGVASVVYWHLTEAAGHGDLRFYGLVQFYPMLAVPLACWLFPGRHTRATHIVYMILWYGLAKAFENWDRAILGLLGGSISGHTLKHLTAAVAAYMLVAMLRSARVGLLHAETED